MTSTKDPDEARRAFAGERAFAKERHLQDPISDEHAAAATETARRREPTKEGAEPEARPEGRCIVKTHRSAENFPRAEQLAWKIAETAADPVPIEDHVIEMIGNRIIDNAAVAAASLKRQAVASARAQAIAHSLKPGASIFGV